MPCTTHLVHAVEKETLQERIRLLFFYCLNLIEEVSVIIVQG